MIHVIADISLYPLHASYDSQIHELIRRLRMYPEIVVEPGSVATVLRGSYDAVFGALKAECLTELTRVEKCAIVIKLINTA